jgi:hypothetical protein
VLHDPGEPTPKSGNHVEPRLDQVQRWMQSILMHPGGVAEGVEAPVAQREIGITLERLSEVIRPSLALSSANRLEIYVNAYHARLMECLDEEFAVTRYAVGEELFAALTFGYLQHYPSESYTLCELGRRFPQFLAESRLHARGRPDVASDTWPDFIIELATLERALYEVYDGPGTEVCGSLDPAELAGVAAEAWQEIRLHPAPCLRLFAFMHDVSTYWGERKDDLAPVIPVAERHWLAICRRDFIVERIALDEPQFVLLSALVRGETLPNAIGAASEVAPVAELEGSLGHWFAGWMAGGFFAALAE